MAVAAGPEPTIILGPVIGKVTNTSARVLLEVDHDAKLTCTLTPQGGNGLPVKQTLEFRGSHPRCFHFTGLSPDTVFVATFEGAKIVAGDSRVGRVRTYRADDQLTDLRVVSLSCNSMLPDIVDEPVVWDDLWSKFVSPGHVDLVLHIGDQVYADRAFDDGLALLNKVRRNGDPPPRDELIQKVADLYKKVYRQTWNYPPTKRVLANVANMMLWDDHDLRNDWGSHSTDYDPATNVYWVGIAARFAFWEYQRQLWDDQLLDPLGKIRENGDYIKTEGSMHKFGDFGLLVVDDRGSRSFYRESQMPFLSTVQWEGIKAALSPGGFFSTCKAVTIALTVAVCVCGSNISKAGGGFLKDKMGFGLFPAEQQLFIEAIYSWLHAAPPGTRDLAVLGGDLHIGVKSRIMRNQELVCHQYLTSPMREHPPEGFAYTIFKAAMHTAEHLHNGFSYDHLFFIPERNFGVLEMRGGAHPYVRCILCHRDNKREMLQFWPGKLIIQDISGSQLLAKDSNGLSDPYFAFSFLGHHKKTGILYKTLNPRYPDYVELDFGKHMSQQLVESKEEKAPAWDLAMEVAVWDHDQLSDDFIGAALIELGDLCMLPQGPRTTARLFEERSMVVKDLVLLDKHDLKKSRKDSQSPASARKHRGTVSFKITFLPSQG